MRLFVAVWPSDEVLDALAALPRPEVPRLRWTTRDQWHVTLRFMGEVDDVSEAAAALAAARAPACEAVLGPDLRRLGAGVLVAPVAGLDTVAAAVVDATAGISKPPPDRVFRGHVTLARLRPGARPRGLTGVAVAGRWAVGEVCLVASRLHPQGARYETIATVPLVPGAGPR